MKKWEDDGFFIGEDDFYEAVHGGVLSRFAGDHIRHDYFESFDGKRIGYFYAKNPEEKAAIVILHGFCEFVNKFYETMYYFYCCGYSVYFIEHRGHGASDRSLPELEQELDKVHVVSYEEYVEDLHIFMENIVKPGSTSGRLYMFAHSMGGTIGSLYNEEYPNDFDKAVLSSPMHKVYFKGMPDWIVNLIVFFAKTLRWDLRYSPTQHGFKGVECDFSTSNSMLSEARFNYAYQCRVDNPRYSTFGGTYGWLIAGIEATKKILENADKYKTPTLLAQAGRDNMVDVAGQEAFLKRVPSAKKVQFPESKHEIFDATTEIRRDYFRKLLEFYGEED